ncbi:MAG TPA: class I SAM-dependent methyltransferase [Candidatus Nanoarchaeia archaeon]|nr:class I SAM-dependent methyltransferase [Candidatus Nanoarchaeia archaeon]
MKKWNPIIRTPDFYRYPNITSNIYLHFSTLSEDIQKYAKYAKGTLLDIGAGLAPYKPFFKNVKKYVKMDNFEYPGAKPDIIGNALDIPLKNNSVDSVFSSQVLEHVPNPKKMVDEVYRVLKRDGVCILTTHMAQVLHGEPHDYFRFTEYGLKELFKNFKYVEIKPNGGALLAIFQFFIFAIDEKFPIISKPLVIFLNLMIKQLDKIFFDKRFTINYLVYAIK